MSITVLALLFFVVALLYSSVGFGGGSSYIALLLIAGLAIPDIRLTALLCNIVVVSGSCIHFIRAKMIPWKEVLPIVILSVPFAFFGGTLELDSSVYKIMASLLLITASILMFIRPKSPKSKKLSNVQLSGIGGGIGFVSGAIGIGGGIFLSPVLHLIQWQNAKIISATASFFILINSISGIAGQLTNEIVIDLNVLLVLCLSVFVGGQIGNFLNLRILDQKKVKIFTAVLIGVIGIRILFTQLS